VKNNEPTKSSLPESTLNEQELDKVSAGGTNKTPKNSDTPKESISLNFTEIKFTYTS
jgi:type VI protein secretion system component Hcp